MNKFESPWIVKNVTGASIKLNMCGELNLKAKNKCADEFSQVCFMKTNNEVLNYGSILRELTFKEDVLTATFFGNYIFYLFGLCGLSFSFIENCSIAIEISYIKPFFYCLIYLDDCYV